MQIPDFTVNADLTSGINALGQGLQLRQQRMDQNALGAALPGALGGDQNALAQIFKLDPNAGLKVQQYVATQNENKRKLTTDEFNALDQRVTQALANTKDDTEAAALWPKLHAYAAQTLGAHPEALALFNQHFTPEYSPVYRQMAVKPQEPFTLNPGDVRYGPNGQQIAAAPAKPEGLPDKARLFEYAKTQGYTGSFQDFLKTDQSGSNGQPYFQFLPGADGYLVGNARTGQIAPGMVGGQRAMPGALDPNLQQRISAAKETGQGQGQIATESTKKVRNANSTLSILDDADALIPKATGSGLGAMTDNTQAFFGGSNEGADAISKLQVLSAALTANVPRMEGPQSDRDVQMYKEAAGNLGDPRVPRSKKVAAVQTIRSLQDKYKTLNGAQAASPAGAPHQITSDAEFNALPSGAEFIGPDGKRRRKP